MKKNIKGMKTLAGRYTLQKNKDKKLNQVEYVITKQDLVNLAKQQEGNKILEALDGLSDVIKSEKESVKER